MSYRKAAEKNGWRESPSAASRPADDDAGTPPSAPGNTSVPSPEAAADASETPSTPGNTEGANDDAGPGSGLVLTLETARLNLGDVLLPAVQVDTLLDADCQSGVDDDSCEGDAAGLAVNLDVDAGLDTNGLALVPQEGGLMLALEIPDLNLDDVLLPAVQVGTLLDVDCQSGADDGSCGDDSTGVAVSLDVDAGLDTSSLAIAPQGLCLPGLSELSGLLAGGAYTGDCDGPGGAADDGPCGCESSAGGTTNAQADISIDASLDLGGADTDALSLLLNGTSLLGGSPESDGLLGGVLGDCGDAEIGEGMPVVPQLLPAIDGVLDGLIASTDLLQAFDAGGCNA